MLFSKSFFKLAEIVQKGLLDGILLKPLDSQFYISFQYSNITKILRTFICIGLNIYLIQAMHIQLNAINILNFIILSLLGLVILYSISVILFSFLIWNPELSNLYSLIWDYLQASRYPREVFSDVNAFIFLVMVPVTFIVTTPSKALLHKTITGDFVWVIAITIITFVVARKFWRFSLRGYTSSSL
jgi:ABC-2 type transport system permease protein